MSDKRKDKRKRTRCKVCGKRVNLAYKFRKNSVTLGCPNCGASGTFNKRNK